MLKKTVIYCASALLWGLGAFSASALTLSPATQRIQALPGEAKTWQTRVFNEGGQAVMVTPSLSDWNYDARGQKIFRPVGTFPFSLAPYLKIDGNPFLLQPRQSRLVTLQLNVPEGHLGGYHGMAFFHAVPHTPDQGRNQVKMAVRLGSTILYENPETTVIDSRITAAEVSYQKAATAVNFALKVLNEGNTWIEASAVVAVLDASENFVGSFKVPRHIVLRGQSATLKKQWKQALQPGTYQVLITYQYRGKNITITRSLVVS